MKKIFLIILFFLLSTFCSFANDNVKTLPSALGIVKDISYIDNSQSDFEQTKQIVEIKIVNGEFQNTDVIIENILTGNPFYDINLRPNNKVILHVEQEGEVVNFSIENIHRSNWLCFLVMIFSGLLIYVGKRKGLYSLVSIIITCLLITKVLSPLILLGLNPVISTIFICIISTALTMYLVGGFNRKSTSATVGCILSLIIAGFLSLSIIKVASINGFIDEQSMFLYSAHPELNFVAITISTMILATLGAVMDVAISIASTINEIYSIDNEKTVKELFVCGMNVGRDIIGTMANTLILVYLGSSLPLLLLASNVDFNKFLNLSQVFTEISSALIGSIAIVICVPVTALISSELIKKVPKEFVFFEKKD